jgi:dihydroflavonol-4-reductase
MVRRRACQSVIRHNLQLLQSRWTSRRLKLGDPETSREDRENLSACPRDWEREDALAFWFRAESMVFVVQEQGGPLGYHRLDHQFVFRSAIAVMFILATASFVEHITLREGLMAASDLVLVTGANGFIAKHVIKAALARGYRVRGTLRRRKLENSVRAVADEHADRLSFVKADLMVDKGWPEAAAGCRYAIHVASPFPLVPPEDRHALVPEARDGTLRVLKAAAGAGVDRTVLTSSCAAVWSGHRPDSNRVFTEADWALIDSRDTNSYALSKTLAEKAAWDFVAEHGHAMTLVTINPSFVLGPVLDDDVEASADLIRFFLRGRYPVIPNYGVEMVDVRDVAEAHLSAMEKPEAAGQRFIVSGGPVPFRMIGPLLARQFPAFKNKMPWGEMPDLATKLLAVFDRRARAVVPDLGPVKRVSTDAARNILGMTFRPADEAITAMAKSLIELKMV